MEQINSIFCHISFARTLSNHLINLLFQSSIKLQRLAFQKCIIQDMRPFRRPTILNGPCPTVQSVSASFGVCYMSFAMPFVFRTLGVKKFAHLFHFFFFQEYRDMAALPVAGSFPTEHLAWMHWIWETCGAGHLTLTL